MLALSLLTVATTLLSRALAIPTPPAALNAIGQCEGGEVKCCLAVNDPGSLDRETQLILGLVEADVGSTGGLVGTHCTGMNVLAAENGSDWCVVASIARYSSMWLTFAPY
jgi:Fungal hydrophobin